MMFFDAVSYPVLFAAGLVAAIIVVLALEIYNSRRVSRLTYPVYEFAIRRAEEEAARIVENARAEARQLMDKAEAESLSLAAAHKTEEESAERAYMDALDRMDKDFEARLAERGKTLEETQTRLGASLEAELKAEGEASRAGLMRAFDTIEKENAARIDEHVAGAFAAAKQDADAYERARKEAVDTHIFELVGDVMKIVLKRSLPPEVHAELVRAALQEAKQNSVF